MTLYQFIICYFCDENILGKSNKESNRYLGQIFLKPEMFIAGKNLTIFM